MGDLNLQGTAIVEKDNSGDILWTWIYPALEEDLKTVVLRKLELSNEEPLTDVKTVWGHFKGTWYYATEAPLSALKSNLDKIASFAIVSTSSVFNPELYLAYNRICMDEYAKSGNATVLVRLHLELFTKGSAGSALAASAFDARKAYVLTPIKEIITQFGMEAILLYTALLLKKRVAVYAPDKADLLKFVRTLPQFVFLRLNWNIVRPWVHLEDDELADLREAPYVAGFTDREVENRQDLYDVFVSVPGASVSIASHAADAFALGKVHKEIAMYMTQAAENETVSNLDIIKELVSRTKELLGGLEKLADPNTGKVAAAAIRERKMQASLQTFLINLASAENMLQL